MAGVLKAISHVVGLGDGVMNSTGSTLALERNKRKMRMGHCSAVEQRGHKIRTLSQPICRDPFFNQIIDIPNKCDTVNVILL